jgi:hypothetical protein
MCKRVGTSHFQNFWCVFGNPIHSGSSGALGATDGVLINMAASEFSFDAPLGMTFLLASYQTGFATISNERTASDIAVRFDRPGTSARGTGLTSNEIFNGGISGNLQAAEFGREGAIALGSA